MPKVYLSLGSNLGDRFALLQAAFEAIKQLPGISDVQVSKIYETTPVSTLPQGNFLNAACSFVTDLSPFKLLADLQKIEESLGKTPKAKNAPRPIDIDILFFGEQQIDTPNLHIPHPAWKERLFVLVPLSELTHEVICPFQGNIDLKDYLRTFPNPHQETVQVYKNTLRSKHAN